MIKTTWLIPLATVLMLSCGGSHKQRAIRTVVASDAVADELAESWAPAVDAQIAHCKTTVTEDTPEARGECMGLFGKGKALEVGLSSLVVAQTAIKEAVKCEEFKLSCSQKVDWEELYTTISDAVGVIVPFFRAMKGASK
jgi:hypothetical protein